MYSTDGNAWQTFTAGTTTVTLANAGDKMYLKAGSGGNTTFFSFDTFVGWRFTMTGSIAASGNVNRLLNDEDPDSATLTMGCYMGVFAGCSSLASAPALPATTLAMGCYTEMFQGCTSLVNAPALPATTLADNCYDYMFWGCTSLVNAPALPATTLAEACYHGMFENCTSLTTAPVLSATMLAGYCYSGMFYGCSSLTAAPALPATTLADACYQNMFRECYSLSSISVAFTAWNPSSATNTWLAEVAASGTFTCPAALPNTRGASNIPSGWTKVDTYDFDV